MVSTSARIPEGIHSGLISGARGYGEQYPGRCQCQLRRAGGGSLIAELCAPGQAALLCCPSGKWVGGATSTGMCPQSSPAPAVGRGHLPTGTGICVLRNLFYSPHQLWLRQGRTIQALQGPVPMAQARPHASDSKRVRMPRRGVPFTPPPAVHQHQWNRTGQGLLQTKTLRSEGLTPPMLVGRHHGSSALAWGFQRTGPCLSPQTPAPAGRVPLWAWAWPAWCGDTGTSIQMPTR